MWPMNVSYLRHKLNAGGAYGLLDYYFRSSTDLALQSRLVFDLGRLGVPVPPGLTEAERQWYGSRGLPVPQPHHDADDDGRPGSFGAGGFDSELASIYELPLTAQGALLTDAPAAGRGLTPDTQAVAAALAN